MRTANFVTAIVSALAAPLFVPDFGYVFAVFAVLPIAWWALRGLGLARVMGVGAWNAGLVAVITVAIAGAAITSGGVDSPITYLAGLTALYAHATFPDRRVWLGLGAGVVTLVLVVDLASGTELDRMAVVITMMLAAYLPFMVRSLVTIEQIHRRRAVVDPLTGCLNRRALDSRAAEIEEQSARTTVGASVISFDIDHFKSVNDVHGHLVGDRVLAEVAYVARKQLRRFELMYRLGGEEFAVILPGLDLDGATEVANGIRSAICATEIDGVTVTVSVGVTYGAAPLSIEALLGEADREMYRAKNSGRNCVATIGTVEVLSELAPPV